MIRVLQVLPRLRRGGSQAMVMNLYRAINKNNIQFDFIIFTEDHDDYYDEICQLGGRIFHFSKFNGKNIIKVRKEWNCFFTNHPEYKILHSHVRSFASIYIPIAKKHGLVTIIHSHSTSNGKGIIGIAKSILEYPLRFQADYLFACSTEAGKWLFGDKAVNKSNYRFIPNAIQLNKFVYSQEDRIAVRKEYNIFNEPVVGHVGGFETPKNHKFIIECFRSLLKNVPDAKLMLVGDGTYELEIRRICNDYGLSKSVIFTGLQSAIGPFLSAMDVFLFPSIWEGLPVSVVEAQASGLRCLLSDSITRDVELSDLLVYHSLSESADSWAHLLKTLIPKKRAGASDENIKLLTSFDCETTIKELEDFYTECVV